MYRIYKLSFPLFILVSAIMLQAIALYFEFYSVIKRGQVQLVLRTITVTSAFLVLLFKLGVSPVLRTAKKTTPSMFGLFCISTLTSIIIGLISQNTFRYLFADIFRMGVPWIFYWMTIYALRVSNKNANDTMALLDGLVTIAVIDAVVTIFFASYYWGYKISSSLHLYGIGWALFRYGKIKKSKRVIVCVLCLIAAILCGKRGHLVAMPTAIFATFVLAILKGATRIAGRIVLTAFGVVMLIASILLIAEYVDDWRYASISVRERYSRNLNTVTSLVWEGDVEDSSFAGRLSEFQVVKRHLLETPLYIITGAGYGATAKIEYNDETIGSRIAGRMHQVHIGWGAYLFRGGIIGVLLYAMFFLVNLHRILLRNTLFYAPVFFYLVLMLVLSFKSNVLLEDISLPIIAALTWVKPRMDAELEQRNTSE